MSISSLRQRTATRFNNTLPATVLIGREQELAAAPLLVELLQGCPGVKALVTSRTVLHVRLEHEFPLAPLALPDLSKTVSLGAMER